MPATASPAGQRVLLHNITWETYERLLAENVDNCGTRFTYDEGKLEIMVVSAAHEGPNRSLAYVVGITAEETGRDCKPLGSTTFKRGFTQKRTGCGAHHRKPRNLGLAPHSVVRVFLRGFEPDSCFYFQNAAAIRGKTRSILPSILLPN